MIYLDDGIMESVNKIFTAVIVGGIERNHPHINEKRTVYKACINKFVALFSSNIFFDEYAFLYEMLVTLRVRVFTQNQLESVIYQNEDLILDSPYIDLSKWTNTIDNRTATNDEKIEAFRLNIVEIFEELSNNTVSEEEFDTACEIYLTHYINELMLETAQNMSLIMSDLGYVDKKTGGRSYKYKGVEDAKKYYNEKVKIIRELSFKGRVYSKIIDDKWLAQELRDEDLGDDGAIIDLGIPEIDTVIGKLRRGNLLGVLGPTKGGKTKMCNYITARCLQHGLNVVVWPLEGTSEEWEAMQTALLIRQQSGVVLDSKRILEKIYESNDIKQLVIAAKTQIATDVNRGKLSFISGTAYVEDFIDVLQEHYDNDNKFDVIVIDSLVNTMSKGRKTKVERISEAYMLFKDFIANQLKIPVLGIVPAQIKQDVVDQLRKNPDATIDITAGGESAETIRSPDEVIGLFSTKEERNVGIMKIYSVASRHSANFDDFSIRCELSCCNFYSDPELNK